MSLSSLLRTAKKATNKSGTMLWNNTIEEIRKVIEDKEEWGKKEYRKRCNVCNKVFCYTGSDIEKNSEIAARSQIAKGSAVFQAIAGTAFTASSELNRSDSLAAQIKDYSKCPFCNSTDVRSISDAEWYAEQTKYKSSPQISVADEIKKSKELLDAGIITQDEFDAIKKQLLNL